jgi:DNA end-binding protein Ku
MRQRESLAVLRVRDRVIVLQTLLWPDEVRAPEFDILDTDVELRPQELTMAQSLVESLAADFEPDQFEDEYAKALAEMVEAKLEGAPPVPVAEVEAGASTEVVDLLTALQRSVERARASRGEDADSAASAAAKAPAKTAAKAPAKTAAKAPAKTAAKAPAKKTAAKAAATEAPAKKTAAKTAKAPAKMPAKAPAKTAKTAEKAAPAKRTRKSA